MPEQISNRKVFSLLEVARSIQATLNERYTSSFWVKAEMNKLNYYSHSGHCYPELVEKSEGKVIAQMKSVLWKDDYISINSNFLRVIREPLKDGIKILFLARILFEPEHGLSLRILDIDPSYTLGDLEREKQETIRQLKAEGLFNRNKTLHLPLLPQRVAVISVETSKGYADFRKVIEENGWNYCFFQLLFPSQLQGEKAVETIVFQLERIRKVMHHFDVVAIIRGGGGDVGLSCYNQYPLARAIALFPLPVITGIGHSTNETVVEMVSFENAITPTKLGEFLIQRFHNFSVPVQKAEEKVIERSRRRIDEERARINSEMRLFRAAGTSVIQNHANELRTISGTLGREFRHLLQRTDMLLAQARQNLRDSVKEYSKIQHAEQDALSRKISEGSKSRLRDHFNQLQHLGQRLSSLDPANVLKRGYSITLSNGKLIRNPSQLSPGDVIDTLVQGGTIRSTVQETRKNDET